MGEKENERDVLFSALNSGIAVGVFLGFLFAAVLSFFYSRNFPELTFLKLILHLLANLIFFTALLGLILGVLVVFARFLFRKTEFIKKKFAFFFSALFSLHFCFWMGFCLNAIILRYSRELKSYLADLGVVLIGVILFVVLYRALPSVSLAGKSLALRIIAVIVFLASGVLAFSLNPFSQEQFVLSEKVGVERNYDSQGKYLNKVETPPESYNVILFSIDTLRADGPSCYGNPRLTTPVIDQLAEEGILFRNAVAQSSWTLPSHMTMVTSLMPTVHGCKSSQLWIKIGESLSEYRVTLAEILKYFGFATAAFTDGSLVGNRHNFDQGFDICDDKGGGIAKISKKAMNWLNRNHSNKPFFLFMHCYDVHCYRPPKDIEERFVRPYSGKLMELKKAIWPLESRITSNAFYSLSESDIQFIRDIYDATIFHTDRVFGEFLAFLKNHDLYDNTIIIVTSDHGEEFWEHGGTGHGWSLHEHQLRVPLVMKSPTFDQTGREMNEWVGIIDITPTILDMLRIPLSNEFQGKSLLPLINNEGYKERVFVAEATHGGHQKSLIKDGYSYLFNQFPPIGEDLFFYTRFIRTWRIIMQYTNNELYHIASDPREKHDILSDNLRVKTEMRSILLDRIKKSLTLSTEGASADLYRLDKKEQEELEALGYIK